MENKEELIKVLTAEHLCSVEFRKKNYHKSSKTFTLVTVKKQIGNDTGAKFEIDLEDGKNVLDIRYTLGGYCGIATIHEHLNTIFQLIRNVVLSTHKDK